MASTCDNQASGQPHDGVALPVLPGHGGGVRASRMSRRRAATLIAVHVIMIAHVAHWLAAGRTLSPLEPSEAMYTLNDGYLNAGFLLFAGALLATFAFGRFFCGWGCHVVAYQDLCAWLLKKIGIKPKPFRSRFLYYAPLALAMYMFVWPTVYRLWVAAPFPTVTNHVVKADFWATFPGPIVAVLTVIVCGFLIVYVLGGKGFCTYGCPYGGFFAPVDRLAVGRILVTDACRHCGHCTAACSSNVRVHEEVALYGMVVDPGCMKCMDCVSVCPNDALHFGFARPAIGRKPTAPRRPLPYDYALWEECAMIVVGVASLLAYRGLYDAVPLLMSMGMAAITAYVFIKLVRLIRAANVRFQNLQFKRGGRVTRAGVAFGVVAVAVLGLTAHSGAVQYAGWRGHRMRLAVGIGDEVWGADNDVWSQASARRRALIDRGIAYLRAADAWGLDAKYQVWQDLANLYLARDDVAAAETVVRRMTRRYPDTPDTHYGLGSLLERLDRRDDAEAAYRRALDVDPAYANARHALCRLLIAAGRWDETVEQYADAEDAAPHNPEWPLTLGRLLLDLGRTERAKAELQRALDIAVDAAPVRLAVGAALATHGRFDDAMPHLQRAAEHTDTAAGAHWNLGLIYQQVGDVARAIRHFKASINADPSFADAHYNLGVNLFRAHRLDEFEAPVREAIRLAPTDPQPYGFLAAAYRALGRTREAEEAARKADALRNP